MVASAEQTRDHDTIRTWADERGGIPAIVKGTEGLLRIDFAQGNGHGAGEATHEELDWEEWFEIFDINQLAFLYSSEKGSKFFKLIAENDVKPD